MLRNLASSLFLTERDAESDSNAPKEKGRVVTTLPKAKEVRPLVEKCITLARKSLEHESRAEEFSTQAERGTAEWKQWRGSEQWQKWCAARAPVVAARRRAIQLLGDKQAVQVLFEEVAPRFADRSGGYTRVLRLATPRLGDAGERAILEFVGVHDRVTQSSEKPAFDTDDELPVEQDFSEEAGGLDEPSATEAQPEDASSDAEGPDEEGKAQAETES